ncbi:DUF4180 domain-containing protein [Mesorhizobium sp. INR15]|uniref:DUF4180 domain-containing protein n=1 Tax=Mesorhizobium sp. INR15 TaxID=2654248 RepID=UPI001896A491|nr:DUF4180 domain-containing protein [Mesorhizobium sp. INR15]QPC90123.1 DUF4180 domain-containing protein [Mesorhizobium sp. INR15]
MNTLHDMHGHRVLEWQADGNRAPRVLDLIGDTSGYDVDWVMISVSALPQDFFQLKTGVAGEWAQKCVNYGVKLAIIGDVSEPASRSTAFADFAREANRGEQLWFLADKPALAERLARRPAAGTAH